MEKGPFKLRSGNKPSISKMAGVSPMKADKDISGVGFQDLTVEKTKMGGNKYFDKGKEIDLKTYVRARKERIKKAKKINPDFKPVPFEDITKEI